MCIYVMAALMLLKWQSQFSVLVNILIVNVKFKAAFLGGFFLVPVLIKKMNICFFHVLVEESLHNVFGLLPGSVIELDLWLEPGDFLV